MKKSTIVFIILDIFAILCFFIVYGPISGFRDYLVTTAMNTKSHGYLAKVFYSEKTIKDIMESNKTIAVEEVTDTSMIKFDAKEEDEYESIYEEQILKRDPDNDLYKIIEIDGNGYHAYLTVIYDPSRVSTMKSSYYGRSGELLSKMAQKNNAIIAINGGGFVDPNWSGNGARAAGMFISNGKIIEDCGGTRVGLIGLTNDNVLTLTYSTAKQAVANGIRDAVFFSPFLIINGKPALVIGNGGYGIDPRTVIAQRRDGIILFLVVDGTGNKYGFRGGAGMSDLISILERYGAYNAANLDGGASTELIVNGKIYNHPVAYAASGERPLPNGWIVR